MAQTNSRRATIRRGESKKGYNDYANTIAKCTRLFFSTIFPDELSALMAAGDQVAIVMELYRKGTIPAIVKFLASKHGALYANADSEMVDTVEDYIQTTMLMLLTLAQRNRFKLHLSPGEIAGYICQWIFQKIFRRVQKEFELRNNRAETSRDIEDYSTIPEFDDILIARRALERDEREAGAANVIDLSAARKTRRGARGKEAHGEKEEKLVRMKEPRSRTYQTKIKKDALRGVFNLVSNGLQRPAAVLSSKAVAGSI